MELININSDSTSLSWLDFLLNRSLLLQHLSKGSNAEPSPTALITQFLVNSDKWAVATEMLPTATTPQADQDSFAKSNRQRKHRMRTLKMMALQVAAFLDWDLDVVAKLPITVQNSLMTSVATLVEENGQGNVFLESLYHRWALRTIQAHKMCRLNGRQNPVNMIQVEALQITDGVLKSLEPQRSVLFIESVLSRHLKNSVLVPNFETFSGVDPNWSVGKEMEAETFSTILHFDSGVYELFDGSREQAVEHFKSLKLPITNIQYLKVSDAKLEGYLRALGLKTSFDERIEKRKIILPTITNSETVEMSIMLRTGDFTGLNSILDSDGNGQWDEQMESDEEELLPLDILKIPADPIPPVGHDQLEFYHCEKVLLESSDFLKMKELVFRLNSLSHGFSTVVKLFSEWELPVPMQHALEKIPTGALRDFMFVLLAKSKQFLNLKNYAQSRMALHIAKIELQESLQQPGSSWITYQYHIQKLVQMIEWEALLIDIADVSSSWVSNGNSNHSKLAERCKDCIRFLEDPSSEVNPRSEVVECVLIILINFGEYKFVIDFEEAQKRWPFVEFLGLVARVCRDFSEKKDASPNYRELWTAVLPICMTSSAGKIQRSIGKESIISNRSSLLWVLDRSCSHALITVFVSLFSRLHNHILDDVGLQIQAELLHVWPNIIDDVIGGNTMDSKSRISGGSKLNIRQVQHFLIHLLNIALTKSEEIMWLKILGDVNLASGNPSVALKCYVEHLAIASDFFEKHAAPCWADNALFRKMIKCCESLQCFTQAMILCQFLSEVDYTVAFGMAQEKVTMDGSDALYGFIWDLTILEFLVNLHTKRNELKKRQEAVRLLGLLELNANNNDEIQREAMCLRKSQFMRTLAKMYIFVS